MFSGLSKMKCVTVCDVKNPGYFDALADFKT